MEKKPILSAKDVEITFSLRGNKLNAIRKCSLDLYDGETLAIVGESGSGKSVGMLSLMGLLAPNGTVTAGEMIFDGEDISPVKYKTKKEKKEYEKKMNAIRGNDISMIFQDPMSYLNPIVTIEKQMTEGIRAHDKCSKQEARERAVELMKMVGIPAPESSHAIAAAIREAKACKATGEEKVILFNLSGHGLIDMASYDKYLAGDLVNYTLNDEDIQKNLDEIGDLAK